VNPPYKSGLATGQDMTLSNDEILVDVKVEAPFYPGLYLAGRLDLLRFGKISDANINSGIEMPWDRDVTRVEAVVGFRPVRNVLVKAGYQWTTVDITPKPDLNVAAVQASVTF
jgi:hypothetical protein